MAVNFDQLLQKIEEIDNLVKTDWKGDEGLYNKLILIKPLCENRLKNTYAGLLSQNDINQLQSLLNSLVSHIQTYKSGNLGFSTHIINTVNAIIPIISQIPFVGKGETSAVFAKIIEDFSQKNVEIIAKITKEKDDLAKEVVDLKQIINNLSKNIEAEEKKVLSLTTGFQEQFSNAQNERVRDFATSQKECKAEFSKNEQIRADYFKANVDKFTTNANSTLEQIENIQKKIEVIYGVIGKSTIVGTQKTYADKAKTMAHLLQGGALLLMLCAVGILLCLLSGQLNSISWEAFVYRFTMGGILLIPAFFLASEAKKQRNKENYYRELEIKMATITPYFLEISDGKSKENVNMSEKDIVKLKLAQNLLSPTKDKIFDHAQSLDIKDIIALVEAIKKSAD